MRLVVLADQILKQELLDDSATGQVEIIWIDNVDEFPNHANADGFIDLEFDNAKQRIELLKNFSQPVIVNSVTDTLKDINAPFVRINAWPGFFKRSVIEASCN